MFKTNLLLILANICSFLLISNNALCMVRIGTETQDNGDGTLSLVYVYEYPYDTNKMTYEEFMETDAGKNYDGPDIRFSSMLQNTKISNSLEKIVYETSPQQVKNIIQDLQDMERSKNYYPIASMLQGPDGSGKSEMIRSIAKRTGRKLVFVNAASIGTMYRDSEIINLKENL